MKRRIDTHEECLRTIVDELKREVKFNIASWRGVEPKQVAMRRAIYQGVFSIIERQAKAHDIPLVDLGLVDYEVPNASE